MPDKGSQSYVIKVTLSLSKGFEAIAIYFDKLNMTLRINLYNTGKSHQNNISGNNLKFIIQHL